MAFQQYQKERLERAKEIMVPSWLVTRLQAYDGWLYYTIQRWILPIVGVDVIANGVADSCSSGPKLDYVPLPDEKSGTLPWKYKSQRMKEQANRLSKQKKGESDGYHNLIVPVVLSTLALYVAAIWVCGSRGVRIPMVRLGWGSS